MTVTEQTIRPRSSGLPGVVASTLIVLAAAGISAALFDETYDRQAIEQSIDAKLQPMLDEWVRGKCITSDVLNKTMRYDAEPLITYDPLALVFNMTGEVVTKAVKVVPYKIYTADNSATEVIITLTAQDRKTPHTFQSLTEILQLPVLRRLASNKRV